LIDYILEDKTKDDENCWVLFLLQRFNDAIFSKKFKKNPDKVR